MRGARFAPTVADAIERIRSAQPARTSLSATIAMLVERGIEAWDREHVAVASAALPGQLAVPHTGVPTKKRGKAAAS
jgi:hypothetical protein